MKFVLQPWLLLFVAFCRWVNQRQTDIIAFENDRIMTLLKVVGQKRILLTGDQHRLLAVKAKGRWTLKTRGLTFGEQAGSTAARSWSCGGGTLCRECGGE